jgi:Zn-dependent protease with chaperone function
MQTSVLATQWFDGKSPRPHDALVRIEDRTLLLLTPQDTSPRRYPVKAVRWPERSRHGQRQAHLPDGSTLVHTDAAQWDAWWAATGMQESVVVGWMQSWRATAFAVAGIAAFLGAGWVWGVPWASRTIAHMVPASVEDKIGRYGLDQLDRIFLTPSKLPEAEQQALRTRFAQMVKTADPQQRAPSWQLHFYASKALGPNAFALPGGYLVVTDELLAMLKDHPDAIMGVLAHELGHVEHKHGVDLMVRASLITAVLGLTIGDASGLLTAVPATLATQSYSREAEAQADDYAAHMLHANGISPAAMAVFFEKIDALFDAPKAPSKAASEPQEGPDVGALVKQLPIAISSHPDNEARIRFFKEWRPQQAPSHIND